MKPITPDTVLAALSRHIGAAQGVRADVLVVEITGALSTPQGERELRGIVVQLRTEGHHICAHPGAGYFLAADAAELDASCEFLLQRAMTTLKQIAAMKRVSLPDLRGQLHLPT